MPPHAHTTTQVEHFSIPQVVQVEGCYSGGRVTVCALPVELLGADNLHTWPLRRLEGKVTQAELEEHASKELAKVGVDSIGWQGVMTVVVTGASRGTGGLIVSAARLLLELLTSLFLLQRFSCLACARVCLLADAGITAV